MLKTGLCRQGRVVSDNLIARAIHARSQAHVNRVRLYQIRSSGGYACMLKTGARRQGRVISDKDYYREGRHLCMLKTGSCRRGRMVSDKLIVRVYMHIHTCSR